MRAVSRSFAVPTVIKTHLGTDKWRQENMPSAPDASVSPPDTSLVFVNFTVFSNEYTAELQSMSILEQDQDGEVNQTGMMTK